MHRELTTLSHFPSAKLKGDTNIKNFIQHKLRSQHQQERKDGWRDRDPVLDPERDGNQTDQEWPRNVVRHGRTGVRHGTRACHRQYRTHRAGG
jgi:hypothetical protein